MPGATSSLALPYPLGSDKINLGDDVIQDLAERVEVLLRQPLRVGWAKRTINNSTPNATWSAFPTSSWDEDDPGTLLTPGRFDCPDSGYYFVQASVEFTGNATGNRGLRFVPPAGRDIGAGAGIDLDVSFVPNAGATQPTILTGGFIAYLGAGEVIRPDTYQNSGGSLNVVRYTLSAHGLRDSLT